MHSPVAGSQVSSPLQASPSPQMTALAFTQVFVTASQVSRPLQASPSSQDVARPSAQRLASQVNDTPHQRFPSQSRSSMQFVWVEAGAHMISSRPVGVSFTHSSPSTQSSSPSQAR